MKEKTGNVSFEIVEVPAPEGALDDLLDFLADLLVRNWIEESSQDCAKDGKESDGDS